MADQTIFEVVPEVKEAQTIVIPEAITIPDTRYAAPSGTLAPGDVFTINCSLVDKDGNAKVFGEFTGLKVTIPDPGDGNEWLAVMYLNFVNSKLPSAQPVNPDPIMRSKRENPRTSVVG